MPAITLHQPWASLIADKHKTVEVRSHRGFACLIGKRIGIHAARRVDWAAWAAVLRCGNEAAADCLRWAGDWATRGITTRECGCAMMPLGAIVCTAFVRAFAPMPPGYCREALCDAAPGDYGLLLEEVRALTPPVPARGRQGVWYVQTGAPIVRHIVPAGVKT